MEEGFTETDEMKMINKGHTPFPYRVAKALDPDIYRNTDFDIWHEIRRGMRFLSNVIGRGCAMNFEQLFFFNMN